MPAAENRRRGCDPEVEPERIGLVDVTFSPNGKAPAWLLDITWRHIAI